MPETKTTANSNVLFCFYVGRTHAIYIEWTNKSPNWLGSVPNVFGVGEWTEMFLKKVLLRVTNLLKTLKSYHIEDMTFRIRHRAARHLLIKNLCVRWNDWRFCMGILRRTTSAEVRIFQWTRTNVGDVKTSCEERILNNATIGLH